MGASFLTRCSESVSRLLRAFYRCAQLETNAAIAPDLPTNAGFFELDSGLLCYGRVAGAQPASDTDAIIPRVMARADRGADVPLPFDPEEVIANLRMERYHTAQKDASQNGSSMVRRAYYAIRPIMPVRVRRHLQRLSLRGWSRIRFPQWPVDRTADRLHEWCLALALKASGMEEIPFIWFWPEGASACASITHDVETGSGRDFCDRLMRINDSFAIKTAFQIVPEQRYEVRPAFLDSIRRRGFEVNIHDLNHDCRLFRSRELFLERVNKINHYGHDFSARGFRSAVLYRNLEWMSDLDFAYDMSVPNVAHLDPQRGGCCTVMPYFIGNLLEIPVTTTQDYSLFNILNDYSTRLWERQLAIINEAHGMATFIIHPDYVIERRARMTYEQLLQLLVDWRANQDLWIAQPGEINDWWRARTQMQLIKEDDGWRIIGAGCERARVAYARAEGERIAYRIEKRSSGARHVDAIASIL